MASVVEKGLVLALSPAESISNPPLSLCRGCFCIAYGIQTTKCSSPVLVRKGDLSITGLAAKLWSGLLWYGSSTDWFFFFLLVFFVCVYVSCCLRTGLWFKGIFYLVTGAKAMPSIRCAALLEIQSRQRQESTTAKRTKVTNSILLIEWSQKYCRESKQQ